MYTITSPLSAAHLHWMLPYVVRTHHTHVITIIELLIYEMTVPWFHFSWFAHESQAVSDLRLFYAVYFRPFFTCLLSVLHTPHIHFSADDESMSENCSLITSPKTDERQKVSRNEESNKNAARSRALNGTHSGICEMPVPKSTTPPRTRFVIAL